MSDAAAAAGGSSALLQYTLGCLQDMRCFGHNVADSQPSAGVTSVHLSMKMHMMEHVLPACVLSLGNLDLFLASVANLLSRDRGQEFYARLRA
ncbi:hypothetical protein E8E14_001144 [Neopestalotiopsis sp. 37M]|nr:hypothetical protein E8E14_001144 [Neopestalotiopsis sp. 37M]